MDREQRTGDTPVTAVRLLTANACEVRAVAMGTDYVKRTHPVGDAAAQMVATRDRSLWRSSRVAGIEAPILSTVIHRAGGPQGDLANRSPPGSGHVPSSLA
jgi:hypothetical protein